MSDLVFLLDFPVFSVVSFSAGSPFIHVDGWRKAYQWRGDDGWMDACMHRTIEREMDSTVRDAATTDLPHSNADESVAAWHVAPTWHRPKAKALLTRLGHHLPPSSLHVHRLSKHLVFRLEQPFLPFAQLSRPGLDPSPTLGHAHHDLPQLSTIPGGLLGVRLGDDGSACATSGDVVRESTQHGCAENDRRRRLRWDDDRHLEDSREETHQWAVLGLRACTRLRTSQHDPESTHQTCISNQSRVPWHSSHPQYVSSAKQSPGHISHHSLTRPHSPRESH